MTTAGWTFLTVSWALIIGMSIFCFSKVLLPSKKHKK